MTRRAFLRGSALLVGATFLWHAVSFAFNSIAARSLGPASFGALAAVMALLYITGPLFVALQTIASRLTTQLDHAGERGRIRALLRFYSLRLGFGAALATAAGVLVAQALSRFLRLPSWGAVALVAATFVPALLAHLQRGVMQGTQRLGRYAASTAIEAAIKLAAVAVLVRWLWPTVDGAVLALLLSGVTGVVAGWFLLRYLPRPAGHLEPIATPWRYSLATLGSTTLLATLYSADVLAAKRYLDPHDAGVYAALSLGGKIVFFATSVVSLVLFPLFASRQERGADSRRPLAAALLFVLALCAPIVALYFFAPGLVVGPLFGGGFDEAKTYLGWMGVAMSFHAFAYLTSNYLLSQRAGEGAALLAVAVLGQLAALYSFHSSVQTLVGVQIVVLGVTAFGIVVLAAVRGPTPVAVAPEPAEVEPV